MISIGRQWQRDCQRTTRRAFLQAGASSVLGLSFADLLRARAAQSPTRKRGIGESYLPAKAKAVILLWLWGGPSQLDTWDPKPDAPLEFPDDPSAPQIPGASPTPTPLSGTWEEKAGAEADRTRAPSDSGRNTVSVIVCPITGLRATENCPVREARSFPKGREPDAFCYLHR